ncbi:MAG TPA: hypothetical protein VM686_40805 [Polyangiaceae bacterium]|nr:hypothetical protein [Polyangiaceae bacterium]
MKTQPFGLPSLFLCGWCLACGETEEPAQPARAPQVVSVAAGDDHTCALFDDGSVKCWGAAEHGRLGSGDVENRGDQPGEMGDALPVVELGSGRRAVALDAGGAHTCAILDDATMKCWGSAYAGRNGSGDEYDNRGDQPGEMGDALPPLELGTGRTVTAVSAGFAHSCALLDDGSVKCWGHGSFGQLGQGDLEHRGDQPGELGDALPAIELGSGHTALAVAAAADHSCALLDDGSVKCWGGNPRGQLGLGDTNDRGDEPGEMGDTLLAADLGDRRPLAVSAGGNHTCVLLEGGRVECFGASFAGVLGQGAVTEIGDDTVPSAHLGDEPGEMGDALPAVDLGVGKSTLAISAGTRHNCALLADHSVKCWGDATDGQLGLGDDETRGDAPGEMGDALPALGL